MKISVIVPVYNVEQYLCDCLDSILQQTFKDFEVVLVDDGSTDSSGDICDRYALSDQRFKVFHKKNGGLSSARNFGLQKAEGEWVTFLDGDDIWETTMLDKVLSKAGENNADMVFVDFLLKYANHCEVYPTYAWNGEVKENFKQYLLVPCIGTPWGCFKKNIITENHISFPENIRIFEDFYGLVNLVLNSKRIFHVDEPLYIYRRENVTSLTQTIHGREKLKDEKWVYEKIFNMFKEHQALEEYKEYIYWRILYSKQYMALTPNLYQEFRNFFPEKKDYILSCPTLKTKMKIMMWSITHHISLIAYLFFILRNIKQNMYGRH